ncbi:uncharacterized protein LOC106465588 isoform X2 [Limulus polyphemus]|uniref:Uncharacterized protein LOC106465588 isoform X2 n=1 Tax=Limulus polyphemus TaxID=6850 RepID=A0ABM1BG10_LIMPO|nr:uncharacterized protein LOC106465588 isoform X2 [Limulus polyphemus]
MSEMKTELQYESTIQTTQKDIENPIKDVNKKSNHLGIGENMVGSNAVEEPALKKAAKEYLGEEDLEETRSGTRAVRDSSKAAMKRLSTMAKTAKEGEALLKELGHADEATESQRRRTRSQTRGDPIPAPPLKRTPRQEATRRGRRGRPRKEERRSSSEDFDQKDEKEDSNDVKEQETTKVNNKENEEQEEKGINPQTEVSTGENEPPSSQN